MIGITGASRLSAILTLDITQFMRNSEIARTELARFQQQAQKYSAGFTRTLSLGLGLVGAASIGVASNFSEITTQLRAIGQGGIEDLIGTARDLGRETKFTSTETATLALELTKMGFSAQDASGALKTSVKISQLFGGSLDKVGVSIAETQRQFKEFTGETRSFEEIGDIFAVAFQNSALDVNNLAGALKNVGSVAKIAEYDLERTVATLGALANAGQKAERGGTRLKTTIIRLGQKLGFGEDQLRLLESGTLDVAQVFDLLKNRAGLAGAVISQMPTEIKLLEQRLRDSKGALDAMNSSLGDQLFLSVARVKAGFEDMSITLGEGLSPFVAEFAEYVQGLAKRFDKLTIGQKENVALFIIMGTVVPVAILVISQLIGVILSLATVTGAATVALAGLAAGFVYTQLQQLKYEANQEKINDALQTFSDLSQEVGGNISNASLPALQALAKQTEEALTSVESAAAGLGEKYVLESAGNFGATAGPVKLLQTLGFIGKAEEGIQGVRRDANVLLVKQYKLKKQLELLTEAIKDKEEELKRLADEQLVLAQQYGAELGDSVLNVDKLQKAWLKTGENIAKALAEFGIAKNDIYDVSDEIARIKDFGLLKILETGSIPTADDFLGDALFGGTLEQQQKLVGAIINELNKYSVQAALDGATELADIIDKGVKSYESLQATLKKEIQIKGITQTSVAAEKLNRTLQSYGRLTGVQFINAEITRLKTQFDSLAAAGAAQSTLKEINAEITKLNAELQRAEFQEAFDKFNASCSSAADTALRFRVALGASKEIELLNANVQKAEEEVKLLSEGYALGLISLEEFEAGIANLNSAIQQADIGKLEQDLRKAQDAIGGADLKAEFVGLDREEGVRQQISELSGLVNAYRNLSGVRQLSKFEAQQLADAETALGEAFQSAEDIANAAAITSFFTSQIQFLGEAFLAAARDGEDFFETLKKSFLATFYALVAKLITLIALYTILAIVSGGTSAASGAASAAMGDSFGSFLLSGLTGVKSNTVTGPDLRSGSGTEPSVKVEGAISGNNLVLLNQTGKRAYDRTFG